MKANELRIGNWVQSGTGIYTISALAEKEILFIRDTKSRQFQALNTIIKPIHLTEEWLIRLGAKKYKKVIYIPVTNLKAEMHFEIYGEEIVTTIKSEFFDLILDRIKHVHQLQNIYHALTGEELTLTDKL